MDVTPSSVYLQCVAGPMRGAVGTGFSDHYNTSFVEAEVAGFAAVLRLL
jgi:hypothetical protein